ncbi:glycosyltransferase family 2 protein [Desulfovibrio litoralis]|uniref:Glycosyl transferase family 2 n=1 Tax=Desulfovibrio litoralis DSM 11393 TaxID=1121455 RepID=A0A1M7T215_9BACT|nr:glycosyltransferase family 2 protein [Desulfovibrio litoralis]SHN64731.1 Glycosyl transferase family 2 [Desulfovibrio litoralis DSM 11393]
MSKTLLTIIMPTYNKVKYIRKALNSVFKQQTNFDFKVIVADDASSDGSVEIVQEFMEKYPDRITLLCSEKNQKLFANVLRAYKITKTDYFCVLDPDDFWVNKNFLQDAIDFLEANKNFTIYGNNSLVQHQNGENIPFINTRLQQTTISLESLTEGSPFFFTATSATVFRNVIFKEGVPQKMIDAIETPAAISFRGDSFRNFIHLERGQMFFHNTISSVYCMTGDGIWTGLDVIEQNNLNVQFFVDLYLYFDKKYVFFGSIAKNLCLSTYKELKESKQPDTSKQAQFEEVLRLYDMICEYVGPCDQPR